MVFEAALQLKVAAGWSTFLNYTYTDAKIKTGTDSGLQLGLIPYSVLQAGFGYQNAGWGANLYATYNSGARRATFANTAAGQQATDFAPSFVTFDFTGSYSPKSKFGIDSLLRKFTR